MTTALNRNYLQEIYTIGWLPSTSDLYPIQNLQDDILGLCTYLQKEVGNEIAQNQVRDKKVIIEILK